MYCHNCNREIPDGTSFCPYCGIQQQAVQQNTPAWDSDDNATVLADGGMNGYQETPGYNYAPPVSPAYEQPPVNQGYQPPVNQGYQQPVTPDYQQPLSPAYNQPVPKKKSKTGLIIGIVAGVIGLIVVIAVVLIAVFASSGSSYDDSYDYGNVIEDDIFDDSYADSYADSYDDSYDDADSNSYVFSAAFQQILDDNALTFTPADFGDLDYVAFINDDVSGMIDIQEMGCDGDSINEMFETICYPTTGFTEEEIAYLDESVREAFAAYETIDCCTVDFYTIDDFYVVEIAVIGLDDIQNIHALQDVGFVQDGIALYLSLSQTESSLVSQGYIKG